ncbi:MAG TPA: ATP-binding protein [Alphaproteobacteria bacterium]|nr:ATP-binding protein [Alphaproteobacteria bacterium]
MNPFRRGYNRIVLLTGFALLLIPLGIEYFQYTHSRHLILEDLKNRLDEHTTNVSLRIQMIHEHRGDLEIPPEKKEEIHKQMMGQFASLQGSLFLIDKDFQILATQGLQSPLLRQGKTYALGQFVSRETFHAIWQEIRFPTHEFVMKGPALVYVTHLPEVPWFVVYVGSKSEIFSQIFDEALVDIFAIAATLIFVVGLGYLMMIRDFISPAQKLVNHIEKENQGTKSVPRNIPSRWQPWFNIVSRIFEENRVLMEDLENRVKLRTKQLQQKNHQLEKTLNDLKKAQNQIIVQEKLASLGALTAGIAHEIKNPLNFIINFSDLSMEYLHELREKISNENELFSLIEQNMSKAREHAERADSIVKGMLAHARGSSGEITTFNLNKLLTESIELAYIGFQGKAHDFSAKITKDFDQTIHTIQGSEQDLARVFLNVVNNACFAMDEKQKKRGTDYEPELIVRTKNKGKMIEIRFEDNGFGIKREVLKKIFNPFFTTKVSSTGTGLGLSLSYDIITHQHHGHISAESKVGEYSIFIIELPALAKTGDA